MRNITTAMKDYLAEDGPTIVTMWEVTTQDATVYRSTDYSDEIIFGGNTFNNLDGMGRTAIQFNSNLTDDNLTASGFVNVFATREELIAGKFDFAEIYMFLINPYDHSMGVIDLMRGNLGNIDIQDETFSTEIHSKLSKLNSRVGIACSPSCRAQLGDVQCGIALGPISTTGSVDAVSPGSMVVSLANSTLIFPQGELTWTSGSNSGGKFEVKDYSLGVMKLYVAPEFDIQVGDTFAIVQGCDKSYSTCDTTYANKVNFRGEPAIPGSDDYFTRIERRDTVSS